MVEYEFNLIKRDEPDYFNYDDGKKLNLNYGKPKVAKDNTISIKPVVVLKKTYTEKQVQDLINSFADLHEIPLMDKKTQQWIKEHF
jgi:hypothetical protein